MPCRILPVASSKELPDGIHRSKRRTKLHVKDLGQGRPVLLIHGWPLTGDMFEYQTVACWSLASALLPMTAGFGQSGHPGERLRLHTFADDLAAVIDGLELQGVALVGFSMGGGEIARYLSRHGASKVSKPFSSPQSPVICLRMRPILMV